MLKLSKILSYLVEDSVELNTANIYINPLKRIWPYKAIRNNIMAQKTTELVLLFNKKTTKLLFLWPNMGHLCLKVSGCKFNRIWRFLDVFKKPRRLAEVQLKTSQRPIFVVQLIVKRLTFNIIIPIPNEKYKFSYH